MCVGFKTEYSALLLGIVLFGSNIYMYARFPAPRRAPRPCVLRNQAECCAERRSLRRYPFWSVDARLVDFYRYYFFHTLSVRRVPVGASTR